MNLGQKIKQIRINEGLTQKKFCELINLPLSTLLKYEAGKFEPGGTALTNIVKHERFNKYMMWLMTDQTNEAVGQISPTLSPDGQDNKTLSQSERKTG
nr:helix-turn-helix transcriptional regulator [Providencia rettgeri]